MIFRGMDIDDLIILALIANGLSITRISQILNLTQPAISQRLSKMRKILNLKLTKKKSKFLSLDDDSLMLGSAAICALQALIVSLPNQIETPQIAQLNTFIFHQQNLNTL